MTSTIRIKRSSVSGNPSSLAAGELAYSALPDNGSNGGDRLYIGIGTETGGNAANHIIVGGKRYTDAIDAATNTNTASTLVKRDASGNFSAGTISASLLGNALTSSGWVTARNLNLTGDATATLSSVNGTSDVSAALTLATVNANVGAFGSSTTIPVITVNAKGLITAVSVVAAGGGGGSTSNLSIVGGGSTSASVSIATDTLTFTGGTGVITSVSTLATNKTVTFAIGQDVSTTSDVTFKSLTVTGNLTVSGNVTTVNSTQVDIADLNITLAKNATTAAQADGAGITIAGALAALTYSSSNDRWNFNKPLVVSSVYGALVGNADTATKWATGRNLSLTGDAIATLTAVDGSAAVSAALTLATVNANVGAFGSSTTIPVITVNAKGLITAVSTNSIPSATTSALGLASFDTNSFVVTSGAVSISQIDGGTY